MKIVKRIVAIVGCLLLAACFAAEPQSEGRTSGSSSLQTDGNFEILYFSRLASLDASEENIGKECNLRATVTHVSALRPGLFVLALSDKPYQGGVPVMLEPGAKAPVEGDEIWVRGRTKAMLGRLGVECSSFAKIGEIPLDFATSVKYSDFRKGMLDFRRVTLQWTVSAVSSEATPDGLAYCVLRVTRDGRVVHVRIPLKPGEPEIAVQIGQRIRAIGCVFPVLDADGEVLSRCIEVANVNDFEVLADPAEGHGRTILWIAAALLGVALAVALVALIRVRRERMRMGIILAERKRMAADLHDTIEQHLASARLVLAGVVADPSLSPRSRELVAHAGEILMRAKAETRDAVLNLRSDEAQKMSPAEAIRAMAKSLGDGGVDVRILLRGLPERLPQGRHQDLLSIVREAVTNALKHGKAKKIVVVCDPVDGGGFALRILNDGDMFDPKKVLGPETGHFGIAGMRERAARSGFSLAIAKDDFGMCVRIEGRGAP